jgi:hypothetical protein
MAKTGSKTKYPNRTGKTSDVQTQREMNVNAQPNNMIDNRIENPSGPALLIRQASELAVRVIENIRHNVEKHSGQIDGKSLIEIKMAGDDTEQSADESDCRRREVQSRKELRQAKADSPIKEKIDNPLELARFVGRADLR